MVLAYRPCVGWETVMVKQTDTKLVRPSLRDYLLQSTGAAGEDDDGSLAEAFKRVRAIGFLPVGGCQDDDLPGTEISL